MPAGESQEVVLVVGAKEQEITCNRAQLISVSKFLARYFEDVPHLATGGAGNVIPLPALHGPAVEAIINALPTRQLRWDCKFELLEDISHAASFLDMNLAELRWDAVLSGWERAQAGMGKAGLLLRLAQLGDAYKIPVLVDYACKVAIKDPSKWLKPHLAEWPAALVPHLWDLQEKYSQDLQDKYRQELTKAEQQSRARDEHHRQEVAMYETELARCRRELARVKEDLEDSELDYDSLLASVREQKRRAPGGQAKLPRRWFDGLM